MDSAESTAGGAAKADIVKISPLVVEESRGGRGGRGGMEVGMVTGGPDGGEASAAADATDDAGDDTDRVGDKDIVMVGIKTAIINFMKLK